jgi:lysophospholipase L1-like esterase
MKRRLGMALGPRRGPGLVAAAALMASGGLAVAHAITASPPPAARYYLALGDSLSTGYQPTPRGRGTDTLAGYVDDIEVWASRRVRDLELVDLGCPGDTTTSLLTGAGNYALARRLHCDRRPGSQLGAALAFLHAHHRPDQVSLVTLDIGINDLNRCAALARPASCLRAGEDALSHNLPPILNRLRAAAPTGTVFTAMTLYDTYLGMTAAEGANPVKARAFLAAYRAADATIAADDARAGFHTADVAGAFATFVVAPVRWHRALVPMNVARTCVLTWACSPPPIDHNIHPNAHGYRVIARQFERAIGQLPLAAGQLAPAP